MSNKIVRPLKRPHEAAVERFYSDDGELVGGERPQYIVHIRTEHISSLLLLFSGKVEIV